MRFCSIDGRAMRRDPSSGAVVYRCLCGAEEPGGPADARIGGAVLGAGETAAMYRQLLANAAFDRVNQRVHRDCPACGLDYMTQVRIGADEVVIFVCACGHREGTEGAARDADDGPRE